VTLTLLMSGWLSASLQCGLAACLIQHRAGSAPVLCGLAETAPALCGLVASSNEEQELAWS